MSVCGRQNGGLAINITLREEWFMTDTKIVSALASLSRSTVQWNYQICDSLERGERER